MGYMMYTAVYYESPSFSSANMFIGCSFDAMVSESYFSGEMVKDENNACAVGF
jgi:hypothetical protein